MPFIGFKKLAELAGVPEEEVREATKPENGLNLDDFKSIVEYVARAWGWLAPTHAKQLQDDLARTEIVNKQLRDAAMTDLVRETERQGLYDKEFEGEFGSVAKVEGVSKATPKSVVTDNYKPTDDPYLQRAAGLRFNERKK